MNQEYDTALTHPSTTLSLTQPDALPTIRDALKRATQSYHDRLEASLNLLHCPLTQADYRELLMQFYGIYTPLEAALALVLTTTECSLDFSQRRKVPLLERDLHALGLSSSELLALSQCSFIPEIADHAQALGCLYVLEGATLGGQVMSRRLREYGYVTPVHGDAFFHSYGKNVGPMWHAFCRVLNDFATTAERQQRMMSTACATFAAFAQWVDEQKARRAEQEVRSTE